MYIFKLSYQLIFHVKSWLSVLWLKQCFISHRKFLSQDCWCSPPITTAMGSFNELLLNYDEPGTDLYLGIHQRQSGTSLASKGWWRKKENTFFSNFCILAMVPHALYKRVTNFRKQSSKVARLSSTLKMRSFKFRLK